MGDVCHIYVVSIQVHFVVLDDLLDLEAVETVDTPQKTVLKIKFTKIVTGRSNPDLISLYNDLVNFVPLKFISYTRAEFNISTMIF